MVVLGKDVGIFRKVTSTEILNAPSTALTFDAATNTITFTSLVTTAKHDAAAAGQSIKITGSASNDGLYPYDPANVSAQTSGHFSIIVEGTLVNETGSPDVIIYDYRDVIVYLPFVCGKSCTLNIETEMIEITTQSSSSFREYEPQYHSWSIGFDGIVSIDESNTFGLDDITDFQINKTKLFARVKAVKLGTANYIYYDGEGYIKSSSLVGQDNNGATFTFNFQGTGTLTQGAV